MNHSLLSVDQTIALIRAGKTLLLAGEESLLARLPAGRWIGGTIPYFMSEEGGGLHRDKLFVTELPAAIVQEARVVRYDADSVARVYADAPANGFSVILIPAAGRTHLKFALEAPQYERFASRPLVGWITGVEVANIGKVAPKAFDGTGPAALADGAIVMHVAMPPSKVADVGIVNIFKAGDGDTFTFTETGFSAGDALVNGVRQNLAQYLKAKGIDTHLPLVTEYCGARVNVSFQEVDAAAGRVKFYAPVFEGVTYRMARPVGDYVTRFAEEVAREPREAIAFSCNCILNYLYASLEGKKTGQIFHPFTFGEVAYQLLNQTLVYLSVLDA